MLFKLINIIILLSISYSLPVFSREISDVNIPETISSQASNTELKLNGAGIRSKFFFDIYIGSLYLETKVSTLEEIDKLTGEKSIRMHFLYSEVSKEKLNNGWLDGFENNLSKDTYEQLQPRIKLFNSFFTSVKKGDTINLNFIPNKGTQVVINEKLSGVVEGDDFFPALLKIWLGSEPADSDLKQAMLGN
ncbi:chalcone isomerase family protein [sulfur-oxidizing endosymbiont of Gigantopelta aegis]|uniref:chalcone isomerase family protein n=1 Tax=sulfur-oxidizing endosymbiont of Gigantopelta aegis TaxID=2794934 RepID=UPI001FEB8E27|nr:chalcone isomerase family protein [sulfur-oxidizing endosymbiont of Gigantopelta aegis]